MKLLHIQQMLYSRPLLITPDGFETIHKLVQTKLNGEKSFLHKLFNGDDDLLDESEGPEDMEIKDGLATIPINGPIGRKLGMMEHMCGACDIGVLEDMIDTAVSYPECDLIAFMVDSPGGSVDGVPDLAAKIADINRTKKTCVALIDGMCCSAAYYLMAGVDSIYGLQSTNYIGSIGCYTYLLDSSRQLKNEGIDPVLIKSGEHKGDLLPGMPITEEMKSRLQKEVDTIYTMFAGHVSTYRPSVSTTAMTGLAYYAKEALDLGLIDGMLKNKSDLIIPNR